MRKALLLFVTIFITACQPIEKTTPSPLSETPVQTTPTALPTATPSPEPTFTNTPPTPSPSPEVFQVCCPLEDETFESLKLIISKPLDIPSFGDDTGHHGVDFIYYQHGKRTSIEGVGIYAILTGSVVLTLEDNYPYGYTILIETPLSDLPQDLANRLMAVYLPVPEDPHYRLYCPEVHPPQPSGDYSVYHLYAHFEIRPDFHQGETVQCGEMLGTVGNSGYSSSPHLHLETRLGPSGADFNTMAHYQSSVTEEQMSNYCLWRMSGYYQLFDPFILFPSQP